MQYPLEEKIGNPSLLVGREEEFTNFGRWLANIPGKLSKSRVILARRKSGKTAFVQRLFNQLWSQHGQVIPFYFSVPESNVWYVDFAWNYYQTFASHYISFLERDEELVRKPLTLEQIKEYGLSHAIKGLVDDVETLLREKERHNYFAVWETAYNAPHRFAAIYDLRFLVMIDEFQYLAQFIYRDEKCEGQPDTTMPGSFHTVVESKVAPMLVTGSYISWLLEIASQYLEAGRLSLWYMNPYLTPDEGLQAVYRYAETFNEPITNDSAAMLNQLCMADPFFISCVVQSNYKGRNLQTVDGVVDTVNYEITSRTSELSKTWGEYIYKNLSRLNDRHSKHIVLHLTKHHERTWTPQEIKEALGLELSPDDIHRKLELLMEADLIADGGSDIRFQGLQDGTLYLILRSRFEEEILTFAPDFGQDFRRDIAELQKDNKRLRGMLNYLSGKMAEYQLATTFRSQKRFMLSKYFKDVQDKTRLNITDVQLNVHLQRPDGKLMELDVVAFSGDGRVVLVEVKKRKEKSGLDIVQDFWEKVQTYQQLQPNKIVLPAILSLGGFTAEAKALCLQYGLARAERMVW